MMGAAGASCRIAGQQQMIGENIVGGQRHLQRFVRMDLEIAFDLVQSFDLGHLQWSERSRTICNAMTICIKC